MPEEPKAYSVGGLLRQRKGEDRWNLALVQRDEVWDVDRMRRLLDSLLAGYPIGALLLCRTDETSRIIERAGGKSVVRDAGAKAWQLLDGQQRINALYTMLTTSDPDHERYGRFYLDLTVERPAPTPEVRSNGKDLRHIVWRNPLDAVEGTLDDFPERTRCLDLSRVYGWAEGGGIERYEEETGGDVAAVAAEIDPLFTHALSAQERVTASEWIDRLTRIWREPIVPVMRAEVQAPEDLLELFARLNRSGVAFHDSDIYFAAVKTFWNEAEPSLKRVLDATTYVAPNGTRVSLLNLEGALRLVSRLAARGVGRGDVIPLRVASISGPLRESMVAAMTLLTAEESPVLARLAEFTEAFCSESRLGYATRMVKEQLWDEVLGWVAVGETFSADDLRTIDDYLLGGTLFAYPTIFGTAFSTLAFAEAIAAGAEDSPFPLLSILGATRARYQPLGRSRRLVDELEPSAEVSDRDRQRLANNNQALLLSLGQWIPIDHASPLDVDHIYPSALAGRMHGNNPRTRHADRWRVNSLGNKWYLDASANRSLQALAPHPKFERLMGWLADKESGPLVWQRDKWAIEDDEIEKFAQVDRELGEDIDAAMVVFSELTAKRAERLLALAMAEFPGARYFARDDNSIEPSSEAEITADLLQAVGERLGLSDLQTATPVSAQADQGSEPLGAWADRADEVEWAFKQATAEQHRLGNDETKRANRTQPKRFAVRYGFNYVRWVWLGAPAAGTHVGVGVVADVEKVQVTPLWMLLSQRTPGYVLGRDLLQRSEYGPMAEDEHGVWIPIPMDPHRQWSELRKQIYDRMQEIREVLSPLE